MITNTKQLRIAERAEGMNYWKAAGNDSTAWHPMTADEAEYCLNVLPPIYFSGGFAVSEPLRHDAKGRPVYLCVVRVGPVPYCRELALSDAADCALKLRNPSADMPGVV